MPPSTISDLDALPAGTRLGEFEIECVLGVGGFGIVYRALDHALERRVAIKEYMPAALAARGADAKVSLRSASHADTFDLGLRSFINEARLLARFDHPSLVKVYRFWEANDTAYMVMPWYEGVTLREARRTMPAPPTEAWLRSLIGPLLGALAVLHREQVYHRDIAPDNILLLGDATGGEEHALPVLLDFGAARHVIGDHTQTLTAILKPSFAPIEQYAEGTTLRQGPWTDFYALAAAVHFCITGRAPVPATTRAVEDELPSLVSMAAGLERDFDRLYSTAFLAAIDHALAVRPQERPASVGDWWRELAASADAAGAAAPAADGVTRTVVFDPAGRRGMDPHIAEPTAYATTAPATAPISALALQRTVPMGAPAQPRGTDGVAAAHAAESAATAAPAGGAPVGAPSGTAAPPASSPQRWMLWALGAMVLITLWALWQLRQAHKGSAPILPTAVAKAEGGPVAPAPKVAAAETAKPARAERVRTEAASTSDAAKPVRYARSDDARAARQPRPASSRAAATADAGEPRAQCGNKVFIALALCMKRVCDRAEYYPHAQCVRFREMEAANRQARP